MRDIFSVCHSPPTSFFVDSRIIPRRSKARPPSLRLRPPSLVPPTLVALADLQSALPPSKKQTKLTPPSTPSRRPCSARDMGRFSRATIPPQDSAERSKKKVAPRRPAGRSGAARSKKRCFCHRPRGDSNTQFSAPETDALSIRPHSQNNKKRGETPVNTVGSGGSGLEEVGLRAEWGMMLT